MFKITINVKNAKPSANRAKLIIINVCNVQIPSFLLELMRKTFLLKNLWVIAPNIATLLLMFIIIIIHIIHLVFLVQNI